MYDGILYREFTINLGNTKVKFSFERFISITKKELAYISMEAKVLKGEAKLNVISN